MHVACIVLRVAFSVFRLLEGDGLEDVIFFAWEPGEFDESI